MKNILFISILLISLSIKAQETRKDTLYFKFDRDYLKTFKEIPNHYYINDKTGEEVFFFEEQEIYYSLKFQKLLNLKTYIHSSAFYNNDKRIKLHSFELAEHLNNFIVYLVDNRCKNIKFIKVRPGVQTE